MENTQETQVLENEQVKPNMRSHYHLYVPEFVYGSMDGLVTTFAIVTGAVGAGLSPAIILVVGFANVLADGFSMGSSSYLAAKSAESIEGGKKHAIKQPMHEALVTFFSFIVVGLIPVVPFLFALGNVGATTKITYVSVVLTGIAFAAVGYVSGIIEKNNPFKAAIRNLLIGIVAALISFSVGYFLAQAFGI